MTIILNKARSANYTPASLIYEWAKANGWHISHYTFGRSVLVYQGERFVYDHWSINHITADMDEVTIYLRPLNV